MKTKRRAVPFEVKAHSDDGTFAGYGSVFDVVDSYKESIAPGAFAASLKSGRMPALLWQHRPDEPIGRYTAAREDDRGLYVEGELALKTNRGAEAHELLKLGALTGLSIGFVPVASDDDDDGIRTLTEVDLWEVSLVTFPANHEARIESVKALLERGETPTEREFEGLLRDAGFTRSQSKRIVSIGYRAATQRDADAGDALQAAADLAARIRGI